VAEAGEGRRSNADGSVFYYKGRGWYAAITDSRGRRVMRKAPRETKASAEKLLRELLAKRDRGELTKGTKILAQFARPRPEGRQWLTGVPLLTAA
jgi:hypothetical protein